MCGGAPQLTAPTTTPLSSPPSPQQCDPAHRLYALYLIDSISKNVGAPYPALLAPRLPRAFDGAWASHPPSRPSLDRLQATWDGVFDGGVLGAVRATVAASAAAAVAPPVYVLQPQPHHPPAAYPQQHAYDYGQPPAASGYGGYGAPPPPPPSAYPSPHPVPGYPSYPPPYGGGPPPPPHYAAPPPPQQPPLSDLLSSLAAAGVIAPPPPRVGSASPVAGGPLPPTKPGGRTRRSKRGASRGVGEPGGGVSPFRAALSPWRPEGGDAPPPAASASTSWAPPPSASPLYPPASDSYAGASLGPPLVRGGGGVIAPSTSTTPSPSRGDLTSRRVRGPSEAARARLLAASEASRPARGDGAAVRARRAAARADSGRPLSRPWYASADDWIAGTAAAADAGPAFFEGRGAGGSGTAPAPPPRASTPPSAPADDGQRTCALTGEAFDSYYDDARGEWRYRDAVRVRDAAASALGLPPGVLVKASAIDGGGDAADPVAAGAAELAVARDLVAATAADDDGSGPRVKRVKAEPV